MSLRIARFNTTCHFPAPYQREASLVDGLARGRLARDLAEHLGPSLSRQPAIVRIRRVPLRVLIPAREWNEDALSLHWRQAFGKALFTALAYPSGAGLFEVYRTDSVAGFIAAAIHELLHGAAADAWQFAEFEPFFRQGSTLGALALICEWPRQSMPVLLELAERRVLERVLARFDDLAMERLFALLAHRPDIGTELLSIADLVAAAKLALLRLPEKTAAFRSRAYALNLYVEAVRSCEPFASPRALYHALLALAALLNPELFWPACSPDELWSKRLPSVVIATLERLAREIRRELTPGLRQSFDEPIIPGGSQASAKMGASRTAELHRLLSSLRARGTAQSPQLVQLLQALAKLRVELKTPPPAVRASQDRWITSEWCGLFFLASTLARLDWPRSWGRLADFQSGGSACMVAGVALAITGKFDPALASLDPAIAVFAGYADAPGMAHLRRVFQESPREVRTRVLEAAVPDEASAIGEASENWETTFDLLATVLLREFASRIRGFRQATRQSIVRAFIARAGTIRVDPERIVVFPDPSPFHVALHIASLDSPVEPSAWLGERRIEFDLADL
jgi:hypothetical protein